MDSLGPFFGWPCISCIGVGDTTRLCALESKLNRTNPGNADSVADIARLSDEVATVARRLDLVSGSFLCDDVGVPITNLFATQDDIHILHGSVQEGLNGTDKGMAEQVRPITSDVQALTVRVAKLEDIQSSDCRGEGLSQWALELWY
ncbi:hypothetical protein B0H10DRAFT_2219767 [Mycena sp. CBHHK59/15]|nr:hypothetical protein B0H10DRAFT_2219767 [Mycena sp. CBHHK59/15]